MKKLKRLWWFWVACTVGWLTVVAPVCAMSCDFRVEYVLACEQNICQPAFKNNYDLIGSGCRTRGSTVDVTDQDRALVQLVLDVHQFNDRDGTYLLRIRGDLDNRYFQTVASLTGQEFPITHATFEPLYGEQTVDEWRATFNTEFRNEWLISQVWYWFIAVGIPFIVELIIVLTILRPRMYQEKFFYIRWGITVIIRLVLITLGCLVGWPLDISELLIASLLVFLLALLEISVLTILTKRNRSRAVTG